MRPVLHDWVRPPRRHDLTDLREAPVETLQSWFGTPGSAAGLPRPVRVLVRLLVTGPERRFVRGATRWLLRL